MRAVVLTGARSLEVRELADPTLQNDTDVLVRVTSSALCGSDLHMYDGRSSAEPGLILGHEPTGEVVEVGRGVNFVRRGDRVVIPTHLFCGVCRNCSRGYSAACLYVRPGKVGAAYGYAGMGPFPGAQAELLRVPYADANCVKLPGTPMDELEDDFVLLADAFVTGWHANELARVSAGSSVAVFGAGAVGLLAAYSAILRGASEVYVVDHVVERLAVAERLGATPINFMNGDPVRQIKDKRSGAGFSGADDPMGGVDHGIDAVGFQARKFSSPSEEDPVTVVRSLAELVNPVGYVGVAGVYSATDPEPRGSATPEGWLSVPWASFFNKGVSVAFGRTHDRRYTRLLRDMIISGKAHPGTIVSHHMNLESAPETYRRFDQRSHGIIKAVINP